MAGRLKVLEVGAHVLQCTAYRRPFADRMLAVHTKCRYTCPFDRLPDQSCRLLDRLSDCFALHCRLVQHGLLPVEEAKKWLAGQSKLKCAPAPAALLQGVGLWMMV